MLMCHKVVGNFKPFRTVQEQKFKLILIKVIPHSASTSCTTIDYTLFNNYVKNIKTQTLLHKNIVTRLLIYYKT